MWFGKSGRNYHPRAVAGFADNKRLPPAAKSMIVSSTPVITEVGFGGRFITALGTLPRTPQHCVRDAGSSFWSVHATPQSRGCVGLPLSPQSEETSIPANGQKIIRILRSYGWAGEASTSCTIFGNCNSTRQGADLTWTFQATRTNRGSKLLTSSST
jgi:hypothetical protein